MQNRNGIKISLNRGAVAALAAALLFGAGTPIAKLLLGPLSPWVLAGLLYLGSGIGLALWRLLRRSPPVRLHVGEIKWLVGAIVAGGIVAPVLLLWGLSRMPASGASLLLNMEGVLTALLAWFVFHESFDRRIALGITLIMTGAVVLSWSRDAHVGAVLPSVAVLGACLGWAIDNNLTRKVALADATFITMAKGIAAGTVNALRAWTVGANLPQPQFLVAAGVVGFFSYGVSLALFVVRFATLEQRVQAPIFRRRLLPAPSLQCYSYANPSRCNLLRRRY